MYSVLKSIQKMKEKQVQIDPNQIESLGTRRNSKQKQPQAEGKT